MLRAAKELATKERADLMFDLIGVACAPHGGQEHLDKLQQMWRKIRNNAVPEFRIAVAEESSPGTYRIPWKRATEIMLQQMSVMRRVNHGR